jgi:hypothetical protein
MKRGNTRDGRVAHTPEAGQALEVRQPDLIKLNRTEPIIV